MIVYKTEPNYSVYFSKTPFYWDMYVTNWHADGTESIAYDYDTETETWTYKTTYETYTQFTSSTKLLWSNHDIAKKSDGSVYLPATDPVTTYTNADVTINGVGYVGAVLPKLPDWDKEQYPYAVIISLNDSAHSLVCFSTPVYFYKGYLTNYFRSNDVCSSVGFAYELPYYTEWTSTTTYEKTEIEPNKNITSAHIPVWANFDLTNEDGTIRLVASDPVPVYE